MLFSLIQWRNVCNNEARSGVGQSCVAKEESQVRRVA